MKAILYDAGETMSKQIQFPMEQSLPIVIYPNGVREEGHGKPGVCYARDGVEFIKVLEFRAGESKLWGESLRHVDDPYFTENPAARQRGAWDYAKGIAYDFAKPEQELDPEARIAELAAKYDGDAKKIAQVLRVKGWNTERVQGVLDKQGATAS